MHEKFVFCMCGSTTNVVRKLANSNLLCLKFNACYRSGAVIFS